MEDQIVKYTATVIVGDEYHPVGETHPISESEVEFTAQNGLKLKVDEKFNIVYYHLYPCSITKTTYQMTPTSVSTFPGGSKEGKIGFDREDFGNHDWKERWP